LPTFRQNFTLPIKDFHLGLKLIGIFCDSYRIVHDPDSQKISVGNTCAEIVLNIEIVSLTARLVTVEDELYYFIEEKTNNFFNAYTLK